MKKGMKKMLSLALALMMLVGLLPLNLLQIPARAAEGNTYVLDATADVPAMAAGTKQDGDFDTFGTEGYFTLIYSVKTKIDGSSKTFEDGYQGEQRINFQAKTDVEKGMVPSISFTTKAAATIKLWWVSGGDGRQFYIYDSEGNILTQTEGESVKNSLYISELTVDAAGSYFLGVPDGSNNLFKMEVTEAAAEEPAPEASVNTLDATTDMQAMAQGAKADGETEVVKDFFTVIYKAKTKIDGSDKTFDDGYHGTQRLNIGGKTEPDKGMAGSVMFKTANAGILKVWWVSGGDGRELALYNNAGEILEKTAVGSVKNSLYISEIAIPAGGTYYLGVPDGSNYIFRLEVTEQPAAQDVVNTLDATTDMQAMAQGAKADGETEVVKDFFTVIYKAKTKIDGSDKTFDDGYHGTQRLNIGGKTEPDKGMAGSVMFKTANAGVLKVWWVSGGDGRELALYNNAGEILEKTAVGSVKNSLYISELAIPAGGTYYLGVPDGSNYIFKLEVTETAGGAAAPARGDWSAVAAPVITEAIDDGDGQIKVTVSASIGYDAADELLVTMFDADGKEIATRRSIAEKDEHTLQFEPASSGNYSFKAVLNRENEESKVSAEAVTAAFSLPLAAPVVVSATSKGNGTVELVWTKVKEAEAYEIYAGETLLATAEGNVFMAEGLQIGEKYAFTVRALRGEEAMASAPLSATVTQEAQRTWAFTAYGPSASLSKNGYEGSINEEGFVTIYSQNNGGKIQPESHDGLAFYYTAIPTDKNFTLRAKVSVDSWDYSNGQEGFGLMVADALGAHGDTAGFWNNAYMALLSKVEYRYEGEGDDLLIYDLSSTEGTKITMKLGLFALSKTGVTKDNQAAFNTSAEFKKYAVSTPLEWAAADWGKEAGTYNIVGNYGVAPGGDIEREMRTEFILEIQKNNTGYFITYYHADGTVYKTVKNYDPDALNQLDPDFVYAGFFASRNARVTFSDVALTLINPEEDAPAEERPVTKITPAITFATDLISNSLDYEMMLDANVDGTAKVLVAGNTVLENIPVKANERAYLKIALAAYGENRVQVIFTPDPNQDLGEFTQLSSTNDVHENLIIVANKCSNHNKVIYVSPDGLPTGNGTKEQPYDLITAVDRVTAGQTIILMEGTYLMESTLRIKRGFDGTENARISMIADPEAKTRPVIDFQGLYSGITHGGDYWYFYGFDVTRSLDGQKGFQVSGNNNILDQIHTYYNGNTGIQISRYSGKDLFPDWPSNNLILNCTSYCNYDAGFEDADGFAAKLTCGEGNVFDGCVAYNNADDGWDLFAKLATGSIGAVTIRNCVAYSNGFVPGVEGQGNGNGFKMGGDSLSGKHVLENSYAFWNLSKGIDSNSCPDIIVKNCVSYNNGSYNVAFYTNNGANTAFVATGILSFKDSTIPNGEMTRGEQLKGIGSQVEAAYINDSNYYWYGDSAYNTAGVKIDASAFVTLEFKGIIRNADGSINMQGFLERSDKAPANAGVQPGGSASRNPASLPADEAHNLPEQWSYLDQFSGHWRECDCGFKAELAEHTYKWVVDKEPTETETGLKHEECTVCGYKRPAVTTYYEAPPVEPTEPTTPAEPSTPTEPSEPSEPTPGGLKPNTLPVVVLVILGAAAIAAVVIFLKKRSK